MSVRTQKKILNLLVKTGISAAIIAILINKIGFGEIKESLTRVNMSVFIISTVIYTLSQILNTYKWQLIANNAGFNNQFREYSDYYFTGLFFNLFLPSTVGGDVSKAYYLSKHDVQNRKAPAVYSVLAERYSGW